MVKIKCEVCDGTGWIEELDADSMDYLRRYPDVAASSFKNNPRSHYDLYGKAEGRTWGVTPTPEIDIVDWEDSAYLYLYPDVAGSSYNSHPLDHYKEHGYAEGRRFKPVDWKSSEYLSLNSDVAASDWKTRPLTHYWMYGKAEGRPYKTWTPPAGKGLHLVYSEAGQMEMFSACRDGSKLLLGTYGLGVGGPVIGTFDGQFVKQTQFPECESVFDIYMPDDNMPLCTNEHYAKIRKRYSGGWTTVWTTGKQVDLMFYIRRAGYSLYANWFSYDHMEGGIVRGDLNGATWSEIVHYNDKVLPGMCSVGGSIYLAGKKGAYSGAGYPILTDVSGNVLSARQDCNPNIYWGITAFKNRWLLGTCGGYTNTTNHLGEIHAFDGSSNTTVYRTDRNVIHRLEVIENKVYAVTTWPWDFDSPYTSQLISSEDGLSWTVECDIPCAHIIGMTAADGGLYLSGGKYMSFGRLYFYQI